MSGRRRVVTLAGVTVTTVLAAFHITLPAITVGLAIFLSGLN
jgi:hypothetical protein